MAIDANVGALLATAELRTVGRLLDSSNNALVVEIEVDDAMVHALTAYPIALTRGMPHTLRAVYKPLAGERPLWDFPQGNLSGREVAAYECSRQVGLGSVPPTVWRTDGPFGPGMCQLWIAGEPSDLTARIDPAGQTPAGWLEILQAQDESGHELVVSHADDDELLGLAVFDVLVNNADRKAGHVLTADEQFVDPGSLHSGSSDPTESSLWAIDHGITFHTDPKLRTVLWGFAGWELPDRVTAKLTEFQRSFDGFATSVEQFLTDRELQATQERLDHLLATGVMPDPPTDRAAIPWPLF